MRDSGDSRSVYEACVHGRKVVSVATDHGIIAPVLSLHFRVIDRPYRVGEEALDAIAADQINYFVLRSTDKGKKAAELTTLGAVK
jgi:hypothetical protein